MKAYEISKAAPFLDSGGHGKISWKHFTLSNEKRANRRRFKLMSADEEKLAANLREYANQRQFQFWQFRRFWQFWQSQI
jgi:hypothetical protein